ncbi:hypothetical protein niasHT_023043 [Heterodera trifolii]|uniref:Secreted protein n=1 Tax=Heterodera trifolii TaxID=157864 RepID=A0ABD2KF07_9BILA
MIARFIAFHLFIIVLIIMITSRSLFVIGGPVSFGNSRTSEQKQMAPLITSEKDKHRRHMRHTIKIATTTPATTTPTAGGDGADSAIVLRKALLHPSAGPIGRRYSSECFFTPVNCHHFVRRTVFVPKTVGAAGSSSGGNGNINLPRRRHVGTIGSRRSSSSNNGINSRSSSIRRRRTRSKATTISAQRRSADHFACCC